MYPNRRGLERLALALVLLAAPAWAHDSDVIYVMLSQQPTGGALDEVVTLTAGTLSQLAPIDADNDGALSQGDLDARGAAIAAGVWDQMPLEATAPCTRSADQAVLRDGYVELGAHFVCPPGPLSQDFKILRVLTSNYRVVLGRQLDGETGRAFAQGNVQKLLLSPEPVGAERAPQGFEEGGVAVFLGFDLAFALLLALLLAGSVREAAERWAVFVGLQALCSLGLGLTPLRVPEWVGAVLVAVAGCGYALGVLGQGKDRWALLALLGIGTALRQGVGFGLAFEAGYAVRLLVLAVIAVPIFRMIARRPTAKRRTTIGLACASLAGLGFSLVQTLRTF